MSTDDRLERLLTEVLDAGSPHRPPDRLEPETLRALRHVRRWPRWLALLKEPPMRLPSTLAAGSPMARVMAIATTTILLAVMVAAAGITGSRLLAADDTIVVEEDGNGTVTTITEAVDMAVDGDTILVMPGTYDESVTLTKDVTIRGDGDPGDVVVELSAETPPGASCDAPDLPLAFSLEGSDATLENLTIRGESARVVILGGAPLLRGLVLDGIGRVYALDPGSTCVPTGLDINEGSTATIMDSVLIDTDVDIETGSSPSFLRNEFSIGAIWMQGAGVDPVIRGNELTDSVKWGISIGGGAQPMVLDNTIVRAQQGIEVDDRGWAIADTGTDPVIRGNTIVDTPSAAISVGRDASATIESNTLRGNAIGISAQGPAIVDGNHVEGGKAGIIIVEGAPMVVDNTVEGLSGRGIVVGAGTSPTLSGNTSCGNDENLTIADSATPVIDETNEICEDTPAEAGE